MIRSLLRALPAAALLWGGVAEAQDSAALAAVNKLADGGFEASNPSYWTRTGAGATWPTSQFHSGTHSIALGGPGEASWTQSEVIRNWVDRFPANTALALKVWVRADGINTAPTTDAGKYQMVATFRDANGADLTGGPLVFDMPQTAATSGWTLYTTAPLGDITLPSDARSVSVTVRKGASATGTMYFDDFSVQGSGWHGANVDLPGDWYTYWPSFDGAPATPGWVVGKTVSQAHTGAASLQVQRLGAPSTTATEEAVAISQRVPVTVGRPVVVSYWLKTEGSTNPSTIGTGESSASTDNNVGIVAIWYDRLVGGRNGYGELGGDDIRLNGAYNPRVIPLLPQQAANGWTQYSFVVYPRENSVALELRLRYYHQFTGMTYWDDVFIGDAADVVTQVPNLLTGIGGSAEASSGFEGLTPSYWAPTGAGATWPTSQFHSGTHSIALGGPGEASWTQSEVIRNWVDRFPANTALALKVWVRADGINTAPTTDAGKYQMVATFRDANGADLTGGPLVFDMPQTAATSGWTLYTTAPLGDITLPSDARSVSVTVRKGASATGTMYFDDFSVQGSGWHGANVDLPGDWYTYWPSFDGAPATPGWVVGKTVSQAHTGAASLQVQRLGAPSTTATEEAVAVSPRVPVTVGQPMLVSYWLKTEGHLNPSTIGTGESSASTDNNVGIVAIWYDRLVGGRNGYGELGGDDIRLNGAYNPRVIPLLPQQAATGWTNYAFVVYPRENSVAMETRLRYYHQFSGTTYWDDVSLTNIAGANLFNPVAGEEAPAPGATGTSERWFRANQPNPFSDRTEIRFALPQAEAVTLEVYDLLGRRVALLADATPMTANEHTVTFESAQLSSGTYLVVLRTPSHSEARQITVVR